VIGPHDRVRDSVGLSRASPRLTWLAPHPDLPAIYVAVEDGDPLVLDESASSDTNLLSHGRRASRRSPRAAVRGVALSNNIRPVDPAADRRTT
jgi:hypothetical protein